VIIHFIILYETLQRRPRPTPSEEAPGGVVCLSIKTMPLDGKMAHHGENVCVMCVSHAKSLPSGIFLFQPERTHVLRC
jgi:hypothetical protein